jgi:phage terminase small subunit
MAGEEVVVMSALSKLNSRQRAFVENLAKGMAQGRAYEAAGYKARGGVADAHASRLAGNGKVAAALAEIQASTPEIADRAERQRFWTEMLRDAGADPRVRLKASELLGRAGADFVERHEHSGSLTVEHASTALLSALGVPNDEA